MLFEADRQTDQNGRSAAVIKNRLRDREAPGEDVGSSAIARDIQAGVAGGSEGGAFRVGIRSWDEICAELCRRKGQKPPMVIVGPKIRKRYCVNDAVAGAVTGIE